ncbi:MAG: homoserine kinase [Candidatus Sericytochromatia bacterium]|nr:homoserine kinase [Candidatus Tanganyikabacteria bacterium]
MHGAFVSVPATSANLGPGFDALGMALDMALEIEMLVADADRVADAVPETPPPGRNLIFQAAEAAFAAAGRERPPISIATRASVPLARGLGSSAAAVVAGLVGANVLLGEALGADTLLSLATQIEGHPDNVAPALLGGLTAAASGPGGQISAARVPLHPAIREAVGLVAIVPRVKLATAAARAALPASVPFGDATFNVARTGLLVAALAGGRPDLLAGALRDRLHQPYRAPLVPGMARMLELGTELGALAVTISGAGPTLLAWCPRARRAEIGNALAAAWEVGAEARLVEIAESGATARPLI